MENGISGIASIRGKSLKGVNEMANKKTKVRDAVKQQSDKGAEQKRPLTAETLEEYDELENDAFDEYEFEKYGRW